MSEGALPCGRSAVSRYSCRSAGSGSIRSARCAGTQHASNATPASAAAASPRLPGSSGFTPNSIERHAEVVAEIANGEAVAFIVGNVVGLDVTDAARDPADAGRVQWFVLLLDKMISDNIDPAFFKSDVERGTFEQRSDGKLCARAARMS